VVRRAVSAFSCRSAGKVRAVELMEVSGLPRGGQRPMWVVYVTGALQYSFGPWPSAPEPSTDFEFVDPHGLEGAAAIMI
jgi:hypothetical protein